MFITFGYTAVIKYPFALTKKPDAPKCFFKLTQAFDIPTTMVNMCVLQ